MTRLCHHAIAVSRQRKKISDLESVTLRFERQDFISMALQSPDNQGRYRISNHISYDSNDTTLSTCHRSLQTNREDIGSRISDPPIHKTRLFHHAITVIRRSGTIGPILVPPVGLGDVTLSAR
ncbi:hypothetical protein AVEN_215088-1 [Araneus ventricosus]|uniref:Uncharacterized protein n=1 Tax=Araneus ventricosus TaxID=182803 RepID=A0A4Y2X1W7_ARAVE|nr:hypothetical protein AVEN_215088-1 [Araneus ventricosus]